LCIARNKHLCSVHVQSSKMIAPRSFRTVVTYVNVYAYLYVNVYAYLNVNVHAYLYVNVYMYLYVRVYVYICTRKGSPCVQSAPGGVPQSHICPNMSHICPNMSHIRLTLCSMSARRRTTVPSAASRMSSTSASFAAMMRDMLVTTSVCVYVCV